MADVNLNNLDAKTDHLKDMDIVVGDQNANGGIKSLNLNGNSLPGLADGVNPTDAATVSQTEEIAEEKAKVISQSVHYNGNQSELNPQKSDYTSTKLYDAQKEAGNGYGKDNVVTYFTITKDEVIALDPTYAKTYFIHEALSTTRGYLAIHQDIIKQLYPPLSKDVHKVYILPDFLVKLALGKFNAKAPVEGQWNLEGLAIPLSEDPNNPNPSTWLKEDGSPTEVKSEAAKATYSSGKCSLIEGKAQAVRGTLMLKDPNNVLRVRENDADEVELIENFDVGVSAENQGGLVELTEDDSSPWFILKCTAGGGTFSAHKLFMVFQTNANVVEAVFRFALNLDIVKGLLNENRDNRIALLEEQVNPIEDDKIEFLIAQPGQNLHIHQLNAGV